MKNVQGESLKWLIAFVTRAMSAGTVQLRPPVLDGKLHVFRRRVRKPGL